MQKFFSSSKNISGNKIILDDKDHAHHIRRVLRLKAKDKVIVFDEEGNEYNCLIKELPAGGVILEIKNKQLAHKKPQLQITLACAIPKKSRIDDIIDKLTQLGVDRIIPLKTERVIVKLGADKEKLRLQRWKKIAQNAAQQSQRNNMPVIDPLRDIRELLRNSAGFDLKIIPTLGGKRKTLKEIIAKTNPKNILILIGPEGDFTDEEVALAKKSGCVPVTLGDLVLRVETAAVAVASFIRLNCIC